MKNRCVLFCLMVVFTLIGMGICTVMDQQGSLVSVPAQEEQPDGEEEQSDEEGQPDTEAGQSDGEYMFVWMSDTQAYSGYAPEVYAAMTEWIADNAGEKRIRFVFHTGDIVDHGDSEEEWQNADKAMGNIDGAVPYSILAGNHDLVEKEDRYGAYLSHFGPERFAAQDQIMWYGNGEASAQILETEGQSYLILALGFELDADILDWANRILSENRDIPAILTAHNYLHGDGTLSTTGRELYQEIVLKNANVHLVLCGHNHNAEKNIAEIDDNGDGVTDRVVYQLLADYQETPGGGNGYMRLITVNEEKRTLHVTTYSPFLDDYYFFDTSAYPGKDEFNIDIGDWFE